MWNIWINNWNLGEGLIAAAISDVSFIPVITRMMCIAKTVNLEYQNFLWLLSRFAELGNYSVISYILPPVVPVEITYPQFECLRTKSSLPYERSIFTVLWQQQVPCFLHTETDVSSPLSYSIHLMIGRAVVFCPKGNLHSSLLAPKNIL